LATPRRALRHEYFPRRALRLVRPRYCGCSYSLRDNNFHRAKEGLPPIKPARGDVYSDPLADSAEESPEVVNDFFTNAPAFSEEVRAAFKSRRRTGGVKDNNW
jgi:hypothetical protein